MAEYLSPGVYVEEVDAGPEPIEGVSTSITGAVGVTARGPTDGKPLLVTSFAEFQRAFGGSVDDVPTNIQNSWNGNALEGGRWWDFALAVKGFFDNGGKQLYVKRVYAGGGLPLSAQTNANTAIASYATLFRGLVTEIERDLTADARPAKLTVRHLFRLQNGLAVTLRNGETGQQIGGAYQVASYDPTTRQITLDNPLPANTDIVASRGDQVIIVAPVAAAAGQSRFTVRAQARGAHGDDIRVRTRPVVGATLAFLPDPVNGGPAARANVQLLAPGAAAANPWTVTVAPAPGGQPPALTGFANGDHVMILGHEYAIAAVALPANTFTIDPQPAGTQWAVGTLVQRLRTAYDPAAAGNQVRLWGAGQLYDNAVLELDNGQAKEVLQVQPNGVLGDVVTLSGNPANLYREGQKVRVVEVETTIQYRPGGTVEAEEVFSNLRLVGRIGDPEYIVTYINANSTLVNFEDGGIDPDIALASLPIADHGAWQSLANGDDLYPQLTVDDFSGMDNGSGHRTGIQALEDITDISICVVPGIWSRTVHSTLITHCETLRYRFAILDPRDHLDIQGIQTFRAIYDTKYAALYYPWIEVRDPIRRAEVRLAPSAHLAGLYARVDDDRGVYKAPANEVIRSITQIAEDVTKREQDVLNPHNINALRFFPGRGFRVWGARCVTSDSAWRYINVRRLFIFLEASIDVGTQWVVFEPNDEPTWARVRQSITNFLNTQWRNGALQGKTASEAFFVKCDRTTMTQDDIDNGRLICVIGVAPVKPAEFVIFRIQQKTLDTATN